MPNRPSNERASWPETQPETAPGTESVSIQQPGESTANDGAEANGAPQEAPQEAPQPSWSRRRFLRNVAGGATAALLAACGRDRATPTPTATSTASSTATRAASASSPLSTPTPAGSRVHLPIVRNGEAQPESPIALLEETPTPTEIPTETATPAPPAPTNTPTPPPATPFPPGPASKLGLHVERNIEQIFDLLKTGGVSVVTTLELDSNFARRIKEISPSTLLIGRTHIEQAQLSNMPDPAATARAFVDELLREVGDNRLQYFDGWISYNEPTVTSPEEMQRLALFEAERTRLLGDQGIRSVIGNFATGNPESELWPYFFDAIDAAKQYNGWLGLHEYSAPTIYYGSSKADAGRSPGVTPSDEGFLTLRYRKVYREHLIPNGRSLPLIFTELGVDGLVTNRPGPVDAHGWQDFQSYWRDNGYGLWGPGAYVEQLVWYDEAMRQNDYVVGGCIYGLGTSSRWLSYDIQGPAASVLEQYLSVHAPG